MNRLPIPLPSWLPRWPISLALILVLMAGCAPVTPKPESPGETLPNDPYARANLDELLDFGAGLVGKTSAERAEICRTLLSRQKMAPDTSVLLHLMTGRMFSDACGDIPKILDDVDAIPLDGLPDERMRRLVSVQQETLRRMHSLSKKLAVHERRQKSPHTALGAKGSKSPNQARDERASNTGESQVLRDKLEAIRDMEQRLDESGGVN